MIKLPFEIPKSPQEGKMLLTSFIKGLTVAKPKNTGPQINLACDFGKSKIVFLEVETSAGGMTLNKFNKTQRSADKAKDAEVLKQAFDAGGYKTNRVRISVKGQGVVLRFIQFPQMKKEELRSAISFEVEQYIPFKSPEVVWDFHVLDENIPLTSGGNGMNILLVAVKRDELYMTIQTFQAAGLEIELIDVDALAAINAFEYFQPDKFKQPAALLDIGSEISTLSVILDGKPRFIRDVSYGGLDIIRKLKRKLGLTHEQAVQQIEVDREPAPEALGVLKEALSDLVSELKLSINYYLDQVPGAEPIKTLLLSGGGGYHPIVLPTLSTDLGLTVESMDVMTTLKFGPEVDAQVVQKNLSLLPVSLGLCARGI